MNENQERLSELIPLKGTLVLVIATKDGLFIAADKRITNTVTSATSTKTKIIRLNSKTAFTVTHAGTFHLVDMASGKYLGKAFDADDVITNYCQRNNFDNSTQFWDGLKQELTTQFINGIGKVPYNERPETDPPSHGLFEVNFFYIDQNGIMGITNTMFCYKKNNSPSTGVTANQDHPAVNFKQVIPYVAGDDSIYLKIKDENNEEYNDIRNDESVKRLLLEKPEVGTVTIEEAKAFCRKIIQVTSEKTDKVGSTYDFALIDSNNGFKWVPQTTQSKTKEQKNQGKKKKKKRR
jgi:hypothetical protein